MTQLDYKVVGIIQKPTNENNHCEVVLEVEESGTVYDVYLRGTIWEETVYHKADQYTPAYHEVKSITAPFLEAEISIEEYTVHGTALEKEPNLLENLLIEYCYGI